MNARFLRWGLLGAVIVSVSACDGGGGGAEVTPPAVVGGSSGAVPSLALKDPASSNTANNPKAAFSLLLDAGLPALTLSGPPVVNFAVIDAAGKHVPGLKLFGPAGAPADSACNNANARFAMAQLSQVDGIDQWQSLISLQRLPGVNPQAYVEATTDPLPTLAISNPASPDASHPQLVGSLSENAAEGYYTYKFATDVSDPKASSSASSANGKIFTNGKAVAKDGSTQHRLGLQLCYVDPQTRATVKVNPYIDFSVAADGRVSALKDAQGRLGDARKMVDRASCNECHQNLAAHGGGRVDPNFCVICHNPGSSDYLTGNPIDFKLMIHKFHMGKRLTQDYQVQSFVARKKAAVTGVLSGVDYPQNQRNCVKCHDNSATAAHPTAQGNNWRSKPSRNACFACHDDYKVAGSKWQIAHQGAPGVNRSDPDTNKDSTCAQCHVEGKSVAPSVVHAIAEWSQGANFQYTIVGSTWNADRTVTVEYYVSNPVDGSIYDILDPQYRFSLASVNTATGALTGATTRMFTFGAGQMLFGWGSEDYGNDGAIGRAWNSSCTTAVVAPASGAPSCDAKSGLPPAGAAGALTRGQPVAINVIFDPTVKRVGNSNHFTLTSTPLPASATGTGVIAWIGAVNLPRDGNSATTVPVTNAVSYFAIGGSGKVVPRRTVVSADKCNACHGRYINTLSVSTLIPRPPAGSFLSRGHGGSRNVPEACVICHNGNNVLNGTSVIAGQVTAQPDSAHFKRMIHMMHKAQGANFPVMPSTLLSSGPLAGSYTGIMNCSVCHVNNSYQRDLGVIGSSTLLAVDLSKDSSNATITDTDASDNPVISPKAAACSACHADAATRNHMVLVGGAAFASVTQAELARGKVVETCDGCHAPGGLMPVDLVHQR